MAEAFLFYIVLHAMSFDHIRGVEEERKSFLIMSWQTAKVTWREILFPLTHDADLTQHLWSVRVKEALVSAGEGGDSGAWKDARGQRANQELGDKRREELRRTTYRELCLCYQ